MFLDGEDALEMAVELNPNLLDKQQATHKPEEGSTSHAKRECVARVVFPSPAIPVIDTTSSSFGPLISRPVMFSVSSSNPTTISSKPGDVGMSGIVPVSSKPFL
nr:hypothetical protein Iba_scaffold9851CG0030 [Ipomoea batatas]